MDTDDLKDDDIAAPAGKYSIRAVDRVCDIIDAVGTHRGGATLTQVAAMTEMPKSSVFRYLTALEARNYVVRSPQTLLYELGLAFQSKDSLEVGRLKRFAEPILLKLRDEIGETSNLGLLDNGQVLHAIVVESLKPMRLAARVGERGLIHSTALGKILAADLDEETVRAVLKMHGMPRYTEMTVTDAESYLAQLRAASQNGYAMDDSENQIGGRCIAVRVPGISLLAGVSISAPATQMPLERVPAVVAQLQEAAVRLGGLVAEHG